MRRALFGLSCVVTMIVSACSSDGAEPAASGSSASSSSASAKRIDPVALANRVTRSVAVLRSARFAIGGSFGDQSFSGAGVQKLARGELTGLQADAKLPTIGAASIVVTGSDRFVKLPPPIGDKAKPWLRVSTTSSNVIVQQLATFLDAALAAGSLGSLDDLVAAAQSAETVGRDRVQGVDTTRYRLVIDAANLPKDAGGAVISADVPVELWLDTRDRPVQIRARPTVAGQKIDVSVGFNSFDDPVTITAPPAGQIAAN